MAIPLHAGTQHNEGLASAPFFPTNTVSSVSPLPLRTTGEAISTDSNALLSMKWKCGSSETVDDR